jgi:hypothetical protein
MQIDAVNGALGRLLEQLQRVCRPDVPIRRRGGGQVVVVRRRLLLLHRIRR